jgi:hypothetical protein
MVGPTEIIAVVEMGSSFNSNYNNNINENNYNILKQ